MKTNNFKLIIIKLEPDITKFNLLNGEPPKLFDYLKAVQWLDSYSWKHRLINEFGQENVQSWMFLTSSDTKCYPFYTGCFT